MDFVVVFNKETQDVTINGQKFDFDEREIVKEILKNK